MLAARSTVTVSQRSICDLKVKDPQRQKRKEASVGQRKWTTERRQLANAQKALRDVQSAVETARVAIDKATDELIRTNRAWKVSR